MSIRAVEVTSKLKSFIWTGIDHEKYLDFMSIKTYFTIHLYQFFPPIFPFPHDFGEISSLTKSTKGVAEVQGRDTHLRIWSKSFRALPSKWRLMLIVQKLALLCFCFAFEYSEERWFDPFPEASDARAFGWRNGSGASGRGMAGGRCAEPVQN